MQLRTLLLTTFHPSLSPTNYNHPKHFQFNEQSFCDYFIIKDWLWNCRWSVSTYFIDFLVKSKIQISDGLGTRNLGFGLCKLPSQWASWTRLFLHSLPNVCHIWRFFRVEHTLGAMKLWKIIKYAKRNWQIMKKAFFNLPKTHFLADY